MNKIKLVIPNIVSNNNLESSAYDIRQILNVGYKSYVVYVDSFQGSTSSC